MEYSSSSHPNEIVAWFLRQGWLYANMVYTGVRGWEGWKNKTFFSLKHRTHDDSSPAFLLFHEAELCVNSYPHGRYFFMKIFMFNFPRLCRENGKKNIFGWNKPEQFGLMLFKASSHTTVRIWYENDSFRWRRWQRVKCLILSLSLTQCSTSLLNFIISASEEGKKFFKKKKMLKNFSYSNN